MEAGSGFESQMCKWNSSICTTANPSYPWFALWRSSVGPVFLPLPFAWEQTPQRGSRKINSFCSFTCCWHQAGFIGNESSQSFSQFRWRWFRRWRWEVGGFCLNLRPVEALFAASFFTAPLGFIWSSCAYRHDQLVKKLWQLLARYESTGWFTGKRQTPFVIIKGDVVKTAKWYLIFCSLLWHKDGLSLFYLLIYVDFSLAAELDP